jgi:hypothetical protein
MFQQIFNDIKNSSNQWDLTPKISLWKFEKPFGTPTPTMGVDLRVWGFTPSHSFALPWAWDVTPGLPSWLAPLQALALVANTRLGLWQEGSYGMMHVIAREYMFSYKHSFLGFFIDVITITKCGCNSLVFVH